MSAKKYAIIILIIAVCVIAFFVLNKVSQQQRDNKIFAMVEAIDYSSSEQVIVDKIAAVLEETRNEPRSAERWGRLGMNLYIHNFTEESVPAFKRADALNKEDFRWPYFCAIALNKLNSAEAIPWFERSLGMNPHYPPLCIRYGNRCLLDGEQVKAREAFNAAIESGAQVPHAHLGLAKVALLDNSLEEAQAQLRRALDMAPQYREAHVLLADVYRRNGNTAAAEVEFQIIPTLPGRLDLADPIFEQMVDEGTGYFWYQVHADKYMNAGQYDKAETEFKKALGAKHIPESYKNLGLVYQNQKQYDKAIEYYQQALALDPNYVDALNNLGVVYFEIGESDRAIELIQQSLKVDENSLDGYLNLGSFLKKAGRRADATAAFRKGMEFAPHDMRFAYQLSWLLATASEANLRDGREALRLAEKVCEHAKFNTPSALDLLAAAYAENNNFEKAIDIANHAYQLAVNSGQRQLADAIKLRRSAYEAHRPYREK